jgi:flagellar hook-associated protein 3 FlgL
MPFRVTNATIFDAAIENIRQQRLKLQTLQNQAGSGRRIHSISDDPAAGAQLLGLRRTIDRIEKFQSNMTAARGSLTAVDSTLGDVTDRLIRLRELAVSADIEVEQFDLIQPEVEELLAEIIRLGNSRSGTGYLFGGYRTDSAPFDTSGNFSGVPPMTPLPAALIGEIEVEIGESAMITTNVLGATVFKGDADGDGTPDAGKVDIFQVVADFRDALAAQDTAGISDAIGEIDQALDQVLSNRGIAGARLNRLDVAEGQLQSVEVALETERSGIEDIDLVETATQLVQAETTLQASLAVTARILQHSLVDFLS